MIPPTIHQIWLDKKIDNNLEPPSKFLTDQLVYSLKNKNPNYNYMFWNNKKIYELPNNPIFSVYKNFYYNELRFHIEKCDFSRYMILYLYGGIYTDLDFHCTKSFDIILNRDFLWTEEPKSLVYLPWGNEKAIFNGFLASKPRHKIWIKLMDYIMYTYSNKKTVMDGTGPVALGRLATKLNLYDEYDKYFVNMCIIRPNTGNGEFVTRNCSNIETVGHFVYIW